MQRKVSWSLCWLGFARLVSSWRFSLFIVETRQPVKWTAALKAANRRQATLETVISSRGNQNLQLWFRLFSFFATIIVCVILNAVYLRIIFFSDKTIVFPYKIVSQLSSKYTVDLTGKLSDLQTEDEFLVDNDSNFFFSSGCICSCNSFFF